MACKVSLQSSLATLIAISVANSGNGSVQVVGRCIAYVRPATRIPSTLLHLVPMPAWEQRKLGDVTDSFSGGTPDVSHTSYYGGSIPFIRSAEINSDKTELFLTEKGLDNSSAKIVERGTVLYALYGATSGEVGIAAIKGAINQAILALSPHTGNDPLFLASWLRREKARIVDTYLQGGQGNLSGSIVKELSFALPQQKEQQVIGSFFSRLDNLITLHQRKYDKLVIFKKSMLEKMFPKDGESVPEIRFAGFTDPWEQRKLENLASFGGGHTPPMADAGNYVDGKILWITSQDVKQHYIENTTTMISEKGAATLTLYPSDSIVIVARSGILRHTIPVAKLRKPATVNQDIKVIQTVDSCDSSWLLQYFIASNKTLLREYGKTGTTVESIDFAKMKSTALMVPYIEEQQAIGSFFSRLDDLITLHQRKRLSIRQRSPVWS